MNSTLEWFIEKRILYWHTPEILTMQHVVDLNEDAWHRLDQGTPLVHFIINTEGTKKFPVSVAQFRSASKILAHPNLGWVIIVSDNSVINFVASVVTQIVTKVRYRSVRSVEDALQCIQGQDQSINWENSDEQVLVP